MGTVPATLTSVILLLTEFVAWEQDLPFLRRGLLLYTVRWI